MELRKSISTGVGYFEPLNYIHLAERTLNKKLGVIETHPIQYHAPVYRVLQQELGVSVTAIYGSDFSVAGYRDAEFGATFRWDTDLLSGYDAKFLTRVADGGARAAEQVSARGLREQLRAANPDAVMLVGYSPRFHRDAFFAARRGGCPLLFRGETSDHAVTRSFVKQTARDFALRAFYSQFRALLYVGARSREHFLRLGAAPTRLFFSPYCVDTTPFQLEDAARERLRAMTRAELGIAPHEQVLLFSGKLAPRKDPALLVRAVKNFSEQWRAETHVLFVGDGELRKELSALADEAPRVNAHFVGFQNQTQLSRFFHAADIFVLPSRIGETWGLVVNEALHHGLPCVVSDRVGSAPDLVIPNETGEIFRAEDENDLTRALERALGISSGARNLGAAQIDFSQQRLEMTATLRATCVRRAEMYSTRRAAEGIARAFEFAVGSR